MEVRREYICPGKSDVTYRKNNFFKLVPKV